MIRKQLSKMPVERGNRLASALVWLWLGHVIGFVTHEWTVPLYCIYAY